MPSTRSAGISYPTARAAKVLPPPPAMPNYEIAHWLLTTFKITGAWYVAAKVRAYGSRPPPWCPRRRHRRRCRCRRRSPPPSPTRQPARIACRGCRRSRRTRILRRVHYGHLTTVEAILLVREDLTHHVDQRPVSSDEPALLTVRGEEHVARVELQCLSDGDRLLAGASHVERRLALTLRLQHAVVVDAGHHHRSQPAAQRLDVDVGGHGPTACPSASSTDHRVGKIADLVGIDRDVRAANGACRRNREIREIGLVARTSGRLGDLETKRTDVRRRVHGATLAPRPTRHNGAETLVEPTRCSTIASTRHSKPSAGRPACP